MATYSEQLAEVQKAISATLKAQSFTHESRSLTRVPLEVLQKREQYLIGMVAREARGGGIRMRGITKAP